jgi:putative acetyltransferase
MNIRIDDLTRPEVHALLNEHLAHMHSITPAESVHALPIDELRKPDITFWCAWDEAELLGCGALKELTPRHGEVKSMRTVRAHLRKGVARAILVHIIDEARRRAYERLSLETGSMKEFEPARRLYAGFGFASCPPFGDYIEDPNSLFMTKKLS